MPEMDKYTHSVVYKTRIVDISRVNLVGEVRGSEFKGSGDLEEWLGKFDGRRVRILIESLDGRDESHLVEGLSACS